MRILILFFFIFIFSTVSFGSSLADQNGNRGFFISSPDKFYFISQSKEYLEKQCKSILDWVLIINNRNNITSNLENNHFCSNIVSLSSPDFTKYSFQYGLPDDETQVLYSKIQNFYGIELTSVIPKAIWERTKYPQAHPIDGVCYNSALVHSGILSLNDYSEFIQNVEYFTANKNEIVNIENGKLRINYLDGLGSTLIQFRNAWETNKETLNNTLKSIKATIANHFSPGSIMCFDYEQIRTKQIIAQEFESKGIESNIKDLPDNFYLESRGTHCATFVTPEIIIESNLHLPVDFVDWKTFWKKVDNGILSQQKINKIFYMQVDNESTLKWSKTTSLFSGGHFSKMLNIIRKNHMVFEKEPMDNSVFDLYTLVDEPKFVALKNISSINLNLLQNSEFKDYYLNYKNVGFPLLDPAYEIWERYYKKLLLIFRM